jgi:competence protein ComGF
MKNNCPAYHFAAFSVLEVTVVIALMALLSGLFFAALNRFNEQVGTEKKIREELNEWFAFRANLWRELDEADSIKVKDNGAELFTGKKKLKYSIVNDELVRTSDGTVLETHLAMNSIRLSGHRGQSTVEFSFAWKNEEMNLSYPLKSDIALQIDEYFLNKKWQ